MAIFEDGAKACAGRTLTPLGGRHRPYTGIPGAGVARKATKLCSLASLVFPDILRQRVLFSLRNSTSAQNALPRF